MKAKDVMSKDVITISPSAGMKEIYGILKKTRYGGIPVVDSEKRILGMVTKSEILAVFLPDYFDMLGENITFIDDFGTLDEEFESMPSFELFVAEDIMKKGSVTIDENASLLKVAAVMKKYRVRRVLVEKDNILKGIITRGDICKGFFEDREINNV
ncbi:MAG: CBS domain-containing protein [Candidatus Omnitrophica bacterium]|nr:CBS domain-containing protein [Candidatus Omnitrophota bacterium]